MNTGADERGRECVACGQGPREARQVGRGRAARGDLPQQRCAERQVQSDTDDDARSSGGLGAQIDEHTPELALADQ